MKSFALIGAAGFIAPKHMNAIKLTGNSLVAAFDRSDSVGIIDSYFPHAEFFTEYERFDRHLDKLHRNGTPVDYLSVCTPNYLHDSHIRLGLRNGSNVICEKPLVLNPDKLDYLKELEQECGKKVNVILQLRHHQSIVELKRAVEKSDHVYDVKLLYLTPRGNWYHQSWKGDVAKSGGIATNIGIHFFDMLIWVFGNVLESTILSKTDSMVKGVLQLEKAQVRWTLSIDPSSWPHYNNEIQSGAMRVITVDDKEIDFTKGFIDLHTHSYFEILGGRGFGVDDARKSIELVSNIRNQII